MRASSSSTTSRRRSCSARRDEVHLLGDQVGFVYGNRKLVVTQSRGTFFTKEVGPGTHVERLSVNGLPAYWISGAPHFFGVRRRERQPHPIELYLARNALIWQRGDVTLRLEGELSRAEACGSRARSAEARACGARRRCRTSTRRRRSACRSSRGAAGCCSSSARPWTTSARRRSSSRESASATSCAHRSSSGRGATPCRRRFASSARRRTGTGTSRASSATSCGGTDGSSVATARPASASTTHTRRAHSTARRRGPATAAATARSARSVREGISPGFGDDYVPIREGQSIDVTGVPPGRYVLVHRVNPDRALRESSYANDAASVAIELDGRQVRGARPLPGPPEPADAPRCTRSVDREGTCTSSSHLQCSPRSRPHRRRWRRSATSR